MEPAHDEVEVAPFEGPMPTPTPDSQEFWDACARHQLVIQRCRACGAHRYPPGNRCPECWSGDAEWTESRGHGVVHSFTIMRRAYHRGFTNEIPYAIAIVELDEGVRMVSNLRPIDRISVGMRVEVTFRELAEGVWLPQFVPSVDTKENVR
jgi:uncharacterized OB-fold protein